MLLESRAMKASRWILLTIAGSIGLVVLAATGASAQVIVNPTVPPTKNTGGWVYQAAILLAVIALVTVIGLVIAYMMRAPRFARDEEGLKVVRADRVHAGQELPRRAVDVSKAVPMVVAPPTVPSAVAARAAPAPAQAPVAAPAPAVPTPAPAPAAEVPALAVPTPAPAPAAEAPATAAEAQVPSSAIAEAPAALAATPAPAPAERHAEVSLDQETFDAVLAELLEKGTDRRVAEGQARRATMIAARKKAAEG